MTYEHVMEIWVLLAEITYTNPLSGMRSLQRVTVLFYSLPRTHSNTDLHTQKAYTHSGTSSSKILLLRVHAYYTGGGQNLRTHREVLPVADDFLLLHTEVPFIDYFSHLQQKCSLLQEVLPCRYVESALPQ